VAMEEVAPVSSLMVGSKELGTPILVTVHRFMVQRSVLRTKAALKT